MIPKNTGGLGPFRILGLLLVHLNLLLDLEDGPVGQSKPETTLW